MKRFIASLTALSFLLIPVAPAFALGELPVTPPADTTPPVISGVLTTSVSSVSETIAWTTNELAVSTFEYGATQSYGSSAALAASAAIGGTATLTGLAPSTTYHYCIHATDTSSNSSQSCNSFATPATPDVTAPIVSLVVAVAITTSANITWTTSENTDAQVEYGVTTSYGSTSNLNSTLALTHSVELASLSANTTYHYRVLSHDAVGNLTTGIDNMFTTSATPSVSGGGTVTDTIPPVISDVASISLEPHDANITWTTDELAISTLEYGLTTSYGSSATLSGTGLLAHTAELLGLAANTTYHYCIHATDLAGNVANSCNHSFTTAATETMLDTNPPTVSLVTVNPVTTTTATFAWTTDEVAGGYVEYGTTIGYGSETTFDTNLALIHEATVTGLTAATEYHYKIHSRDEAGNTVVTPDENFMTATLPVSPPSDTTSPSIQNIIAVSVGSSVATIEWDTNEVAVSTLQYGTTSSYGSSATLSASALLAHSTALTGLAPSTTYYYCIHATDVAGNTANSCGHSFTTESSGTPPDTTVPLILVVVHSSLATSSATVAWSTNEPTESVIEYGTTLSYGSATTRTASYDLTGSIALTGLIPSTTYHYRVHSYDAAGNSGISPDYTLTTDALASAPTGGNTPEALMFSSVFADSVGEAGATISWNTNLPSDSVVEYGTGLTFDYSVSSETLVTSHALSLSNLAADTTYEFRVVSAAVGGVPLVSDAYEFTTLAVPVVIDPAANITSVSASASGTNSIFSFSTDETTAGWIEYGIDTSYGSVATSSTPNTAHTVAVSGLSAGTTYHYRVRAIDVGDNITYSEDHTFVTNGTLVVVSGASVSSDGGGTASGGGGGVGTVPAPVPNLVTAEGVDSQIVFSWNNAETPGFAGTIIVRKAGDYPSSPSAGQTIYRGSSQTFTDTSLSNGTTYYYALYSYNTAGQYSNPIRVSTAPKAGVMQIKLNRNAVEEHALSVEHFDQDLQFGDNNLEVEHLQQVLNVVNVHQSKLTTGYFGPLTQAALKKFQAQYQLPQTGVADAATRAALDGISDGWMLESAPRDLALLTTDLKRGDQGETVGDLQEFLAFEGSYKDAIISNQFGSLTQTGVKNFQTAYGVTPVSGYVGYKTRHTIQTVLGM